MKRFVFTVLILKVLYISAVSSKSSGRETEPLTVGTNLTSDSRQGKFFSLFSIVKFSNDACTGTNSYNGTCMTSSECSAAGGSAAGSCASGFGVCCTIIISKCGQTATKNCTYFTNPGGVGTTYTTGGQCSINVKKCDSDVCQLRIDFISFTIAQPTTTNNLCATDVFTVSGASNNVPSVCGGNSGQHMYLGTSANQQFWTLNFILSGSTDRTWILKLTQIPCNSRLTAPEGCLQYFTTTSGTLKSFNFDFVPNTDPARQISNQDYTICIRKNDGFCGICYTACTDSVNSANPVSFTISESSSTENKARTDQSAAVAASGTTPAILGGCAKDWVMIPCGSDQTSSALLSAAGTLSTQCVDKFCGRFFNAADGTTSSATVYSYRTPFEVRYYTDGTETGVVDANNMGFCLNYVQQACSSSGK